MIAYSLVAIIGATVDLGLLWSIAETFNGLMAIPQLNWCIPAFRNRHYTYKRVFRTEEITIIARRVIFPGYYFMRIVGAALQRSNS